MAFSIDTSHDAIYNNVVMATYQEFTDSSGTIDWGDGTTDSVIFPPAGQVTHQYAATGNYTVTAYDSGLNSLGTDSVTVSSVTTRTQAEEFRRSGYHVEPTSISAGDAAYEAVLPAATDLAFEGKVRGDTEQRVTIAADGDITWGSGSGAGDTTLYRSAASVLATDDDLAIAVAGKGLQIKEGSNAKMGTATLTAGAATVATTAVAANSRILITSNTDGGTPGWLRVSARSAGTSFTITSSSNTDTSTVAWLILTPAA